MMIARLRSGQRHLIALRPGSPLGRLADADAREALLDHLRWFHDQAQTPAPAGLVTA